MKPSAAELRALSIATLPRGAREMLEARRDQVRLERREVTDGRLRAWARELGAEGRADDVARLVADRVAARLLEPKLGNELVRLARKGRGGVKEPVEARNGAPCDPT